jgi:beta-lactamase class A
MRILLITVLLCATACSGGDARREPPFQQRVADRVATVPGAVAGVYLKNLGDSAEWAFNADSVFHAASTMKVPVMIEYFRQVDEGTLTADQQVRLQNRFTSIVDGSRYTLNPGDDSDSALYARAGTDVPLRDLVEHMITRSSNLATNAVIELVDANRAQATARSLGASTIMVRRGVEDGKAFDQGLNNTTTARDLGALLESIVGEKAASPDACRQMLAILEGQEFNDEIPAGLPAGTRIAHKTGEITGVLHDAAIVFPPEGRPPFVLVVLTRNIPDQRQARALIQDVARFAWEELVVNPH